MIFKNNTVTFLHPLRLALNKMSLKKKEKKTTGNGDDLMCIFKIIYSPFSSHARQYPRQRPQNAETEADFFYQKEVQRSGWII